MNNIIETLLNFVYPNICYICNNIISDKNWFRICRSCYEGLERVTKPVCEICGKIFYTSSPIKVCSYCTYNKYSFDKCVSFGMYHGKLKQFIHQFKFNNHYKLIKTIVPDLKRILNDHYNPYTEYIFTFIPMHPKELSERGYNQSELIVDALSMQMPGFQKQDIFIKTKLVPAQSKLSKLERLKNIKNIFDLKRNISIEGKKVIVIDDVFTTGATVNECAKVLKKHKAKYIGVLTLARGQ